MSITQIGSGTHIRGFTERPIQSTIRTAGEQPSASNPMVDAQLRRVNARIQQAAREIHLLATLTEEFDTHSLTRRLLAVDEDCRKQVKEAVDAANEAERKMAAAKMEKRREVASWLPIGRIATPAGNSR